jgi:hypothetical protein
MGSHAVLELAHAAAAVAASTRLIQLHLAARLRALLGYLIFLALINVVFGIASTGSSVYFWSYLVLEPLKCGFSIMAVRELFALAFDEYPGIRSVGRWAMYAGVALAMGVSLVVTGFFWSGGASGRAHSHLYYFEVAQRSIILSLAVVIVTILIVLSKYPLHLSRNTMVSSAFFGVLFLSEAAQLMIDSMTSQLNNQYVDWSESVFISVCLAGWAAMLQPETAPIPSPIRFSSPQEEHLLQQLDSLNQLMTRSVRR